MDILFYAIIAFVVYRAVKTMLPAKGIRQIAPADLKKEFTDKSRQFVDVRTPAEYGGRHLKPFQNIPLQQLSSRLGELDPQREVTVICQSGMRSAKAAALLKKKGFTVSNVSGGMGAQ